ncbi:adenylate/guanylate cyclase domain-containing protein [Formosa maritima]|uniref:Adenylate/guanylate cyclase domain-containing protein n=1 Tax=Formosa maritima TaxID=2592046 RepID=A0A5D0G0J7_9FLAO|nr:adenylate/guanylate cyclase domain-containing protein [Formosa maritima]TYA52466.1 adenylate/guanylate cyclase domain-containing protein [Formosa maritima]
MNTKSLVVKYYLAFALACLMLSSCSNYKKVNVKKGVLDLTDWDFKHDGVTNLSGEWEFYWNQLLEPKDFSSNSSHKYIELPGVWNGYQHNNEELPGEGFATFRLRIKNKLQNEKLGLRIPYHFTAYKLWINDSLHAENGKVADSKIRSIAQTLPLYVYFSPPEGDIVVTVQISNYTFDKGGSPATYKLGLEKQLIAIRARQVALDLFLAGILFIMAFHHLGLYYLMKKEIYTLYFSIVCFLVMFRTISLGESFLIELFPDFDFEAYTRLVFIGYFIGPPIFILFIQKLYPKDSILILGKIFMLIGVLFAGCLIFPANVSSKFITPYALILLVLYSYLLFILIRACVNKREGSFVALFGSVIMVGTVINDILYDNQIINTGYYSSYGLVVFIFSQSFLLSIKFTNAFSSIVKLSSNIKKINIASNRFVPSEFLSFLGKESIVDVKLGDHVTKVMTIFFADIRSFTSISESLTPEENFNFINSLLNKFGPIVRKNNGFIDKFIGDGIMALFPDNPKDALVAAIELLKELEEYNVNNGIGSAPVKLGIGINTGTLMLGTIGEEERMDGTVISDSVNLASRLEGLTKIFSSNIIVSENVLLEVKDVLDIEYRFLGKVPVKGKNISVAIYDVFSSDSKEMKSIKHEIKEDFEKAIACYENESFNEAKKLFVKVQTLFPDDLATQYYLDLINNKK